MRLLYMYTFLVQIITLTQKDLHSNQITRTSSMAAPGFSGLLSSATQRVVARTARVASWDHTGLNEDAFVVLPGQTAVLADIQGVSFFYQHCSTNN